MIWEMVFIQREFELTELMLIMSGIEKTGWFYEWHADFGKKYMWHLN